LIRPAAAFLLLATVASVLFWRYEKSGRRNTKMSSNLSPGLANRNLPVPPLPFGYKTAWFAIRSNDTKAVADALQLQTPLPANWQCGIWHAVETEDYSIFVTPPVDGWTLAVGVPVLFEAEDHATQRMIELSQRFGEAQLYASMRISDAYVWARATDGHLVRRFYEGDGKREETGDYSDAEKELGVKFFDASSPESKEPGYWKRKDLIFVDEEYVLKVAGKWSVNPSKLNELGLPPSLGLLGEASVSYPPKPRAVHHKNS
jgi:hypothetical protein